MRRIVTASLALALVHAHEVAEARPLPPGPAPGESFRRIATLPNYLNNLDLAAETVSEIIAVSASGGTLVYTDGVLGEIGLIDISVPAAPVPAGKLFVGGEPTSVSVLGDALALVAVSTGEPAAPNGHLAVVDLESLSVVAELPLGGQPDSIAISPSRRFAAIAIENERDEAVVVDEVEGGLPQAPSGFLVVVDLSGAQPAAWGVRRVELSGLSSFAPEDAEPELVDINARDEAVVTLQENNHVVLVDLESGRVSADFDAGSVALTGVDATEDGVISLGDSLTVPREPDAVAWLPGPRGGLIATANEGDLFGGSRGFSIFDRSGRVLFDSGSGLEQLAVRHGHYPEARSDAKGTEPEAIEYARFGATDYLFVGSERGSFVAVYRLARGAAPELVQLLPAPLGPEGVLAVPSRGLLVVSGEEDDPSFGVRSSVMIYELGAGAPTYPQIISGDDAEGQPIAWSALSGLVASPAGGRELLGVWDGFHNESRILTIDASAAPARITSARTLQGGSGAYDPEGIAVAPDGTLWLASEGDDEGRPNLLIHTDAQGQVLAEVGLPAEVEACRAATGSRDTLTAGFEGVAVLRRPRGYALVVAQQRGWDYTTAECEALDDDPLGVNPAEPSQTRLWVFEPSDGSWSSIAYRLEALPEDATWVGLSEITAVPGGFILIERDDRSGDFAALKSLAFVSRDALADGLVDGDEKRTFDLIPELLETRGWITDKPEGLAVTADGAAFLVTDNDGVDDWSGETWFLSLGRWQRLFR